MSACRAVTLSLRPASSIRCEAKPAIAGLRSAMAIIVFAFCIMFVFSARANEDTARTDHLMLLPLPQLLRSAALGAALFEPEYFISP